MATTSLSDFSKAIERVLDQYEKDVSEALEPGLDKSQNLLISQLKEASPKNTGDYASHWKKGSSGKGYRTVINDKTVRWKNGHDQHLAGILEYSTNHSSPHIESTRRKVRPKIMKILKESIKNGA